MNNFLKRALTGAVFVIILIGSILWSKYSFVGLFSIITLVGVWEFYKLAAIGENRPQKITGSLLATSVYVTSAILAMGCNADPRILSINIPILFSVFIIELYRKSENPFRNIGYTILGVVYVALPLSLLNHIVFHKSYYDGEIMIGFLLILWSSDTFAYLFGTWLGKTRLFERVSPKKSWEGSIGGALASIISAYIISLYFTDLRLIDWLIIAFILVVIGTFGDLVESLYKRSKNVKDSGTLLPGHGGILDRFDSLLLSAPFVYTYLLLVR